MKTFKSLSFLFLAFSLAGCSDLFFKEEPTADPVSVYETLTDDFLSHYGPQAQRGLDLDSLYLLHRAQVSDLSTDEELWQACTGFLSPLNDGHVNLVGPNREAFNSNFWFETRTDDELFDLDVINENYFGGNLKVGEYEGWNEGLLDNRIIYIHLPWIGENVLELPALLSQYPTAEGLILDLRHNNGGDFTYAFSGFASLTNVEREVFTSRTKNGPGPEDWTDWYTWHLKPGDDFFDKPIVVLIDRYTISAGERATMALAALPAVTLLGDTTNGSISTMIGRELPNGWSYTIATQETVMFDGMVYEGKGIPPQQRVVNTAAQMATGQDLVLETALSLF